jgi:MFS family permease
VTLIYSSPYNYNPLIIGVVILSFGAGNMVGSVAGGKWSDVYLRRLREANNGVSVPEVRPLFLYTHPLRRRRGFRRGGR